jgi:quercetin dioxygenase-like cupin family protein
MKVIQSDKVRAESQDDDKFTGTAQLCELLPPQQHAGMRLARVSFEDGARTNWHVHDGEQILYVIEGSGCVATDLETLRIGPGDVARIPAGERHWNGARSGERLVHLAVTCGVETDWLSQPDRPPPCD